MRPAPPPDEEFEALLVYLRDSRGVDFTGYKRPSLARLIRRRMHAVGVDSYPQYADLLQVQPAELASLLDTLLVNVTAAFRDPAVWQALRTEILPEALAALGPDDPIRVWSAACATGEEAYTLAIVLHELLGDEQYRRRVKVYATDIDEGALAAAGAGRYPAKRLEGLTEEQLDRYFEPDGDQYRFRSDLRPSLIFGRHDLLNDAPIPRVLVLACRNTLMYFNVEVQTRVLERFAFALHEHGVLVLGKAEMLLTQSHLFTPVNLPHRLFRARRLAPTTRLAALALGAAPRGVELQRATEAAFVSAPDAQLSLDAFGVVTLVNERAQTDLGVTRDDIGRPFDELRVASEPVELRGATATVLASRRPVEIRDVPWTDAAGGNRFWDIRVSPLLDGDLVLGVHLVFQDVTEPHRLRERVEQLDHELTTAYEELQSSNEELETTNEELQSAVEELETTNEELQTSNEELETMNEELQSTNEELQTLNDELRERTLEVAQANAVLNSVLGGLDLAVVVVDNDYRVQMWNVGAERLTGARSFEAEGRLLLDLPIEIPVDELRPMLREAVLHGHRPDPRTLPITGRFGRHSLRHVQVTPLRQDQQDGVAGAVITLADDAIMAD
jgi:two-component system CheB/CheR fusion protein